MAPSVTRHRFSIVFSGLSQNIHRRKLHHHFVLIAPNHRKLFMHEPLGMKTASISQCRRLTVASTTGQAISGCEWDLDAIASRESTEWEARVFDQTELSQDTLLDELITKHLPGNKTGTIVLWRILDESLGSARDSTGENRFSAQMDAARKHLELVFHRFLVPGLHREKGSPRF